ncbi:MAG: serine/threonine protein kinase [Phycisphaeraceae bacterium]|nr:serine/threonine protein kinase [Phycisphaeraceae bacterium]
MQQNFSKFKVVRALTPSEQKAAFEVVDEGGQRLCLKLIAPNNDVGRVQREILALQTLTHKNVVSLKEYTFSSKGGQQLHYMLEEFIDGDDLTVALSSPNAWARDRASDFFAELCDGISALGAKGVVHRDIKPQNIRVRPSGSPVLIDFGLARHLYLPDLTQTGQGAGIGTPMYFAPEQFDGTKIDIDHRTDLFAVGVLLYQALVGVHPFAVAGMTFAQLRDAVCDSRVFVGQQRFDALPAKWKLLIGKLLAKDRVARPSGADQVAAILRKLRAE